MSRARGSGFWVLGRPMGLAGAFQSCCGHRPRGANNCRKCTEILDRASAGGEVSLWARPRAHIFHRPSSGLLTPDTICITVTVLPANCE